MGVIKNEVGRPSNKTKKIRMVLKLVGVLVVITLAVFLGYYIKDNEKKIVNNKIDNNESNNNSAKEETEFEKNEAKKILDKYVFDNYEKLVYAFLIDDNAFDYKTVLAIKKTSEVEKEYTCNELFGDDLKFYAENSYIVSSDLVDGDFYGVCDDYDNKKIYSYEDVNKEYKKLFGSSITDKKYVSNPDGGGETIYGYSSKKDEYVELSCLCGGVSDGEINYIYDSYTKDDKLHIIFSFYNYDYQEVSESTSVTLRNVTNSIQVNINGESDLTNKISNIFEENESKTTKYEMILTKNSKGDYIFDSLNYFVK